VELALHLVVEEEVPQLRLELFELVEGERIVERQQLEQERWPQGEQADKEMYSSS
jgi:hypothetical protein